MASVRTHVMLLHIGTHITYMLAEEDIYMLFLFSIPQVKHGRTARNVRDLWPS